MQNPVEVHLLGPEAAPRWDAFVTGCENGTFFHLSGWREVAEQSFGHRCYYFYTAAGDRITGVLPLVHIRSRLFSNSLISNAFCVYGGPLARDEPSRSALNAAALDLGQSLGVDYIEYRMREPFEEGWAWNSTLYATFRKEILPDVEANLLAIPRKQRAMVRKGLRSGLGCVEAPDVDRFYRLYSESVRNLGTPVFSRKFFRILTEVFQDDCQISVVTDGKSDLTGVISFRFRDEILPYYGGGTSQARRSAAYDFMYWTVMRDACDAGLKIFDFGRSKRATGSFDFKRHWGFEPTPLHYGYRLLGSSTVPELNPLNPKYRLAIALWKRLPLASANLIGPILSRSLG